MQKITPFLWFDGQAEEAMNFYCSVFKEAKVLNTNHYGDNAPMPKGTVLTATFELFGQRFTVLNGGPHFKFNPAVSFYVSCDSQEEVDHYWQRLTEDGGQEGPCGWLTDKYGLSWQIVPTILTKLLQDKNGEKAGQVMQALMKMGKLDIEGLQKAFDQ